MKLIGKRKMTHAESLTLGSLTHVGMKRSNNQDAFCALSGSNAPMGTQALFAVADGMGGHKGGEVASSMTINGLIARMATSTLPNADRFDANQLKSQLESAVTEINAEVYQAAKHPETSGMGTTLTAAIISGNKMTLAHVGDSRGYVLRNDELIQITRDHSWVAEEIARGTMTWHEAREHPRRNIVTRAIGIQPQIQVDTTEIEVKEGDIVLICSDGLHGLVEDNEIADILSRNEPQQASQELVNRANELGGNDNSTVVVARINNLSKDGQFTGSDSSQSMTTIHLSAPRNGKGKLKLVLKILLDPLWVPGWLVLKVVRLLYSLRRTK